MGAGEVGRDSEGADRGVDGDRCRHRQLGEQGGTRGGAHAGAPGGPHKGRPVDHEPVAGGDRTRAERAPGEQGNDRGTVGEPDARVRQGGAHMWARPLRPGLDVLVDDDRDRHEEDGGGRRRHPNGTTAPDGGGPGRRGLGRPAWDRAGRAWR